MIRALRRRHLVMGVSALTLGPLAIVAGLIGRDPIRSSDALGLLAAPPRDSVPGFAIRVWRGPESGTVTLAARSADPADPLLYWLPTAPPADSLPSDAILIASAPTRPRTVRLPSGIAPGGRLLAVDGAHRHVIGSVSAPAWLAEAPR